MPTSTVPVSCLEVFILWVSTESYLRADQHVALRHKLPFEPSVVKKYFFWRFPLSEIICNLSRPWLHLSTKREPEYVSRTSSGHACTDDYAGLA